MNSLWKYHCKMNGEEECAICLEVLMRRGGTPIMNPGCGHELHLPCLLQAQSRGISACPVCRKQFHASLPTTPNKQRSAASSLPPPTTPSTSKWKNINIFDLPAVHSKNLLQTLKSIYTLLSWSPQNLSESCGADKVRLGYMPQQQQRTRMLIINVFAQGCIKLSINVASMRVTPKITSPTENACRYVPIVFQGGLKALVEWVFSCGMHLPSGGSVATLANSNRSERTASVIPTPLDAWRNFPSGTPTKRNLSVAAQTRFRNNRESLTENTVTSTPSKQSQPITPRKRRVIVLDSDEEVETGKVLNAFDESDEDEVQIISVTCSRKKTRRL
ncbi:hypothetical protein BJ741DRAFT_189007 [Chytriomyces cf. hyalinus JEL632]|nr:hypothetical protein BJ741DRAFT_189007 [Chytriomyces cf. hyalinus JEL632]